MVGRRSGGPYPLAGHTPRVDLEDVADRLYGLPPEQFTAARDAAAEQADDAAARKAVKALRRPSASAWVLNLLARGQPELLEQVLALGSALAEAQRDGRGDVLRELGRQRRRLVGAVTGTAVGLAGRPVTAQVRAEVEQTLEAAVADPASAEAVRSGRLVRSLEHAGFGGVDLEGAVAVQRSARPARSRTLAAPDTAALEAAALDAFAALDDAVRACEDAVGRHERAGRRRTESQQAATTAGDHVRQLEDQLAAARARARTAQDERDAAAREAERTAADAERRRREVTAAQDAAEQARAALDRARRA